MAARRQYILDDGRVILQGSRQVSNIFATGPSLFKSRKRKSSDAAVWTDFAPKKSCLQTSAVGCGRETLQSPQRREVQTEDCTPCKPSKRKLTDAGFGNEAKKSRPEESTKTDSEHEIAAKRRQKERRRLKKAMRRVARARVSDFDLRYEQHEPLGEGGFGSVFAGVRISDQQPVAIKHIRREDVEFTLVNIKKEAFTVPSEVLLMTRAAPGRHSIGLNPSVSLLDWYLQDKGQEVVLVMERPTPSEDLFHYCEKNAPLPEVQAKLWLEELRSHTKKELIRQIVNALVDLHSKRIFHRDIKMENLLVQTTESGPRIRVIDFGCGCKVKSEPFHLYKGTTEFAPPEALNSKGYNAGPTSVWQTGALLYELLRSDDHREFTTRNFLKGKCSLSGLSQECSDFLQACLTLDPNQRISLDHLSHHPWFSLV